MPQTIRLTLSHPQWNIDETLDAEAACAVLAQLYLQARAHAQEVTVSRPGIVPDEMPRTPTVPTLTLPQKIALCAAELEAGGLPSFTLKELQAQMQTHGYVSKNIARDAQLAIAKGLLVKDPKEKRRYRRNGEKKTGA